MNLSEWVKQKSLQASSSYLQISHPVCININHFPPQNTATFFFFFLIKYYSGDWRKHHLQYHFHVVTQVIAVDTENYLNKTILISVGWQLTFSYELIKYIKVYVIQIKYQSNMKLQERGFKLFTMEKKYPLFYFQFFYTAICFRLHHFICLYTRPEYVLICDQMKSEYMYFLHVYCSVFFCVLLN